MMISSSMVAVRFATNGFCTFLSAMNQQCLVMKMNSVTEANKKLWGAENHVICMSESEDENLEPAESLYEPFMKDDDSSSDVFSSDNENI